MIDLSQELLCVASDNETGARPIHAVTRDDWDGFLGTVPRATAAFLEDQGFRGEAGKICLLPGPGGLAGAVLGLGDAPNIYTYGGLAGGLPGGLWRFSTPADEQAVLGFCLGAYRRRPSKSDRAKLVIATEQRAPLALAAAIFMVRDLINLPPNELGPAELAAFAASLAARFGAAVTRFHGAALEEAYPAVAAVGAGSARAAEVVAFDWSGSGAPVDAPLIALCGKGVCFDTGGYDLKPSSAMLRMKKDMGGAALALGLALLIMDADLPIRLSVWIGCAENSVSGHAMRPSDVIKTRAGLSVEIGNTDAEGRLVLGDLLAAACERSPRLLLDFATLTGAARVALGPDVPALLCNDDTWAERFLRAAAEANDPLWRLPLWQGYHDWLKSSSADLANVATKPMAGAIVAGLFLQNFVKSQVPWAHFDCYCWNDDNRPGRPEGGEASGLMAIWQAISRAVAANAL